MIKIENLVKVYKSKKKNECRAINNINLTLPNKGLVFILGKSGSGKSTLLNLIGGLDNITSGNIIVDGNDISKFKEKDLVYYRNSHISFIFQDYHLIEELTVYENIVLSLHLNRIEDKEDVLKALEKVDLKGYENRFPNELSGGERQRVAIARAIIKKPSLILADEPTGNLDTATGTQIVNLLKDLAKECLILIVSHNKNDAYKYADRIIQLSKGEIISDEIRNPNYDENLTFKGSTLLYPNDKFLDKKDIDNINEKIKTNELSQIKLCDDKFIPYDEKEIKFNEKVKIKKSHISLKNTAKLSLKFLKSKILRIVLSSFMTSVIMVILSLSLTIVAFDSGKTISNEMNKIDQKSLVLEKTLSEDQRHENTEYPNTIVEVENDDLSNLKATGFNDNVYELLNVTIPVTDQTNYSGTKSNILSNYNVFVKETLGTIVVDEEFFIDKVGEFELICESEDIKSTGLYITDYVADSILVNNGVYKFKKYNDILGPYSHTGITTQRSYVNGIIKTNYKEKYKKLLEEVQNIKNFSPKDFMNNKDFQMFCGDIYSYLGISYSFNKNFKNDFIEDSQFEVSYHQKMKVNGVYVPNVSHKYVIYEPYLMGNNVEMSYQKYNSMFGTEYTTSTIDTFIPHDCKIEIYRYFDTKEINKLCELTLHIQSLSTISGTFNVSSEIFREINKVSLFTKGYYFDGNQNLDNVIETGTKLNYVPCAMVVEGIHTMTKAVDAFIPIFRLIAIILCIGIVLILVTFSMKMIKDKMHDIGILKAIGARNKSIATVFGLQTVLIALCTILISTLGYLIFIDLANDILISSLRTLASSMVVMDLQFLKFNPIIALLAIALIGVLCVLSLVLPLLKIKNIKPVKIIKTKE